MTNQNLFNVLQDVCGIIPQESDIVAIIEAVAMDQGGPEIEILRSNLKEAAAIIADLQEDIKNLNALVEDLNSRLE